MATVSLKWETGRPRRPVPFRGHSEGAGVEATVHQDILSGHVSRLLAAQRLRTGGRGDVWGLTAGEAQAAMQRLRDTYGAPPNFSFQILRVTCQSYLASAPSIYGAASIFLAARRGGHSVAVCEKHYAGAVKNIDPEARTLEAAMQIETEAARVVASITSSAERLVAV